MSSFKPTTLDRLLRGPLADSIPEVELLALAEAVTKAHRFAELDRVLTGYLIIYAGHMVAEQQAHPWSRRLAALWDEALDEYKLLYPRNWGSLD